MDVVCVCGYVHVPWISMPLSDALDLYCTYSVHEDGVGSTESCGG